MRFQTQFNKTIQQAFEEFDKNNPQVYDMFITGFFQAKKSGKKRVSFKMILNKIRWDYYIQTTDITKYKINDAYASRYARKFVSNHPEYKNFIELRALRA